MKTSAPHRFTVKEYYRLVDIGALDPDARVELIDGIVYDLSPPAPSPAPHPFTRHDYRRMVEAGMLGSDARIELIEGRIHDMSPIGPLHGGIVKHLNQFFSTRADGRWIVSVQDPVELGFFSELQPDLLLLKPAPDLYKRHHPRPDDVLLLVEVADSSLASDRKRKLPIYARAGIVEVWIVNLPDRTIEVHRQPRLKDYAFTSVLQPGDRLPSAAFPDVEVDVTALFAP